MWDGGPTPPRPLSESGRCGVGVLCIIGASHGLVFFWMFGGLSISRLCGLLSWSGRDFGRFRAISVVWEVPDSLDMGELCVALGAWSMDIGCMVAFEG